MKTKISKRIISLVVVMGLLIAMVPMMQTEKTFASEYNITAKINNGIEMGGADLAEIITNYATVNARISSISVLGGVVSKADWQTIKTHMNTLTSLEIKDTVKVVEDIPTGLVGATASKPNTKLQTVSLSQVTHIPDNTFANCTGLTEASLPQTSKIGAKGFGNCISLKSISLGATPPTVMADSFIACPEDRIAYVPLSAVNNYLSSKTRMTSTENSYYGLWNGFMLMDLSEKAKTLESQVAVTATGPVVTPDESVTQSIDKINLKVKSPVALQSILSFDSAIAKATISDPFQITETKWTLNEVECDKNSMFKGAAVYSLQISLAVAEPKDEAVQIPNPDYDAETNPDVDQTIPGTRRTTYLFNKTKVEQLANLIISDQFTSASHVASKSAVVSDIVTVDGNEMGKKAVVTVLFKETSEVEDDVTKATVRIKVVDDNGNPINGAFIDIVDVEGTSRKLNSDTKGEGVFYDVPVGHYEIYIAAKGRKKVQNSFDVTEAGLFKEYLMQPYGIKGVKVSSSADSIYKGEAAVFKAEVEGQAGSSVTQAVTWSIEGNKNTQTYISKNGTLYVSSEETATSIKVIATADDGVTAGSATARIQNPPTATDIKKVDLVITPPKTGEVPQEKLKDVNEYTSQLEWSPAITQDGGTFLPERKYIAKVTLTAKVGYKFPQTIEPTVKEAKIRNLRINKDEAKNILTFEVIFNVTVDPSKRVQEPIVFKNSFPQSRYGDSDYSLIIAGGSGDGKLTYESTNDKVLKVVPTNTNAVVQVVGAGTAKIKVTKTGTKDTETEKGYQPAFLESPELTVKKAVLTATAKDKAIHENESTTFEVKVAGFKKSDNADRLVGYKEPTAAAKDTTIGVHPIVVSGGEPTANYEFKYVDGKLKVVAEGEKLPDDDDDKDVGDTAKGESDKLVSNASGTEVTLEIVDGDLFEDGTKLVVKDVTKTLDERDLKVFQKNISGSTGKVLIQLLDIRLEKEGKSIQPKGKVKVTIEMADTVRQSYRDIGAIYADDTTGKIEVLDSTVYYDKISFNTNHFSLYGLIGKTSTSSNNPQTGDKAFNYSFVIIGLVALGAVIFVPKRKRTK